MNSFGFRAAPTAWNGEAAWPLKDTGLPYSTLRPCWNFGPVTERVLLLLAGHLGLDTTSTLFCPGDYTIMFHSQQEQQWRQSRPNTALQTSPVPSTLTAENLGCFGFRAAPTAQNSNAVWFLKDTNSHCSNLHPHWNPAHVTECVTAIGGTFKYEHVVDVNFAT